MPATTILLLIGAFILALVLALFQYFYRSKKRGSKNAIFAALRFVATFALLLLLINPTISDAEYFTEKPDLVLAVDNSSSIKEFGEGERVKELVSKLRNDPDLRERFEIETFSFGSTLKKSDSLDFEESQTNLPVVFQDLSDLYEREIAPVVLITDGNQTLGEEFRFPAQRFKQPILPVIVGDTARYRDLSIGRVNVNKYAFLNNRFPVEVIVNYSGDAAAQTRLEILKGGSVAYSQQLSFSSEDNSEVVRVELPASAIGVQNFEVRLSPLEAERNLLNNNREFVVQVIDERSKVLIAYSILHPDLGALQKAIESNQQREVELKPILEVKNIKGFQLVILYQPDARFQDLMTQLDIENRNYFLITGPKTNWKFLNQQQEIFRQEITNQSEEYIPVWNENFKAFQTEDIGYSGLPPLEGTFGNLEAPQSLDILLYRELQGIETSIPLLGISSGTGPRFGFLFGTNLWRWRSSVFQDTGSFQKFDDLIGKLVQFLASSNRQERLVLDYEPLYNASQGVIVKAEYFDQSFNFDRRASVFLLIRNQETQEQRQIPFLLKENSFEVDLSSLPAGDYNFTVGVEGQNLSRSGNLRILEFDVEKQFVRANLEGLQQIALQKGQEIYFLEDFQELKNELLSSNSYATIQKSREKDVSLIDLEILLGIIALALSAEWFLRKYYGLI
ncbi:VWA domain-containing protein [Salinimicrobium sp. CAU 1759]